jgi:hypothetical protein
MSESSTKAHAQPEAFSFGVIPHLVDPSGVLGVYWLEPPGVLVRFVRAERGTTEMAQWMTSTGIEQVRQRFPGMRGLSVVLDMRNMIGRSATARSVLMQAGTSAAGHFGHVVILPSVHMGSAYTAVIEASAVALRLLGYRVDVEHDLEPALKKHGMRVQMLSDVRPALGR